MKLLKLLVMLLTMVLFLMDLLLLELDCLCSLLPTILLEMLSKYALLLEEELLMVMEHHKDP